MNMDFGANKTPAEVIKESTFEELILEAFTLVLIVNDIESCRKNLMILKILVVGVLLFKLL